VEPVILQGGFLVYTKFIAMLGEGAMAAHRSAIAVESLSFMPGYGVGVACGVLVGQMLGARRPDRARAAFGESARIGVLLMTLLGVLFAAIPAVLLWPFVPSDPEVLAQAVRVLRIAGIEQPLMALAFVLTGGLRGAGDTRSPVWIAAAGTWGVRVPISYVTAHVLGWGLAGVWITMVLDWGVRAVLAGIVVRRGAWARLSL
jgi:putative MATE family efflux protein